MNTTSFVYCMFSLGGADNDYALALSDRYGQQGYPLPAPGRANGALPHTPPPGSARHSPRKTQTPRFLSDLRWLQHSLLVIPADVLGRVLCHPYP